MAFIKLASVINRIYEKSFKCLKSNLLENHLCSDFLTKTYHCIFHFFKSFKVYIIEWCNTY